MTDTNVLSRLKSVFYELTRIKEWALIAFVFIIFAFVPSIFRINDAITRGDIIGLFTTAPLYVAVVVVFSAQMFLFATNDYYDRHVDALDEKKRQRNPVAAGRVSVKEFWALFVGTAAITLAFSLYFGIIPLLFSAFALVVFYFYTAEPLRFKNKIGLDIITHGLLINTFPYFFCLVAIPDFSVGALFLLFVLVIRSAIAQILQEVRDHDVDSKVEKNTVVAIGQKNAIWLVVGLYVMVLMVTGIMMTTYYFFNTGITLYNLIVFYMCMLYLPSIYRLISSTDYKRSIESLWIGHGRTPYMLGLSFVGVFGFHLYIIY